MYRLTSRGIERLSSDTLKSETNAIQSQDQQASSEAVCVKAEAIESHMEGNASNHAERIAVRWETIPKQEKETETLPLEEAIVPNKRYNLRANRNHAKESSPVQEVQDDSTDDYDPESDPEPELKRSKPNNSQSNVHQCELCLKTFTKKYMLQNHILKKHVEDHESGPGSKRFKCEFCPKKYRDRCDLGEHVVNVHVVDKEFQCSQCSKSFISQKKLDAHIAEKHERLKCKYCSLTYRSEENLQKHLTAHEESGDPYTYRPHKCSTCSKGFLTKSDLRKHEFIHGNDKPFKCEYCPQTYVKRKDCGQHMANKHGAEKPYKCPVCSKAFFLERDLIHRHLPHHYEDRKFVCDKCPAAFKTKLCLHQHIKKHCYVRKEEKDESD